jgi:hypothetical protein
MKQAHIVFLLVFFAAYCTLKGAAALEPYTDDAKYGHLMASLVAVEEATSLPVDPICLIGDYAAPADFVRTSSFPTSFLSSSLVKALSPEKVIVVLPKGEYSLYNLENQDDVVRGKIPMDAGYFVEAITPTPDGKLAFVAASAVRDTIREARINVFDADSQKVEPCVPVVQTRMPGICNIEFVSPEYFISNFYHCDFGLYSVLTGARDADFHLSFPFNPHITALPFNGENGKGLS